MAIKPLLFRFHRGGLDESMQTVIEIKSFSHLIMHIEEKWEVQPLKISIEPYMYDARIEWDTHIVQVTFGHPQGNMITYPVGFLSRAPDEWREVNYQQGDKIEIH